MLCMLCILCCLVIRFHPAKHRVLRVLAAMPAEVPQMGDAFLDFAGLAQGELLHSLRTWIFIAVLQQSIATEFLEQPKLFTSGFRS